MKLWLSVGWGMVLPLLSAGMGCCPLPEEVFADGSEQPPLVLEGAIIRSSLGEWRDEETADGLGPAETAGGTVVQILFSGGEAPYRFELLTAEGDLPDYSDEPTFCFYPRRSATYLIRVTDAAGVVAESLLTIKVVWS